MLQIAHARAWAVHTNAFFHDGEEIDDPLRDAWDLVVVITTFDTDEHVHGALKAGARGFLLR